MFFSLGLSQGEGESASNHSIHWQEHPCVQKQARGKNIPLLHSQGSVEMLKYDALTTAPRGIVRARHMKQSPCSLQSHIGELLGWQFFKGCQPGKALVSLSGLLAFWGKRLVTLRNKMLRTDRSLELSSGSVLINPTELLNQQPWTMYKESLTLCYY